MTSQQIAFIAAAGVFTLGLAVSILRGSRRARPIEALLETATRLESGDLRARSSIGGEDEIAALGTALDSLGNHMEQEAARTQAILSSMSDGLIATDVRDVVEMINPAAEGLLGVTKERAVGRPIGQVFAEAGAPPTPWRLESVRLADDAQRTVAITGSPIAGEQAGTVYLIRNVAREQQLDRMKSEFLSNISHELRTPLTPVIGYAEMLSRQTFPARRAQGFARNILESARALERVTDTLVSFAAIEGGMHDTVMEEVDASALASQAADRWRARGALVSAVPMSRVPVTHGNRKMLARALDELIDNAVKFSDGRVVTVSATTRGTGSARAVKIAVRDEGVGMDPLALEDVRGAFRQADGSERRRFGGLGLGLALTDRVVRLHAGTLTVSSKPGHGSVFSIMLPAPVTRVDVRADSSADSRVAR